MLSGFELYPRWVPLTKAEDFLASLLTKQNTVLPLRWHIWAHSDLTRVQKIITNPNFLLRICLFRDCSGFDLSHILLRNFHAFIRASRAAHVLEYLCPVTNKIPVERGCV